MKHEETLQKAILKYGCTSQITMAVEEMAELLNALAKERRGRATQQDIVTEIADVTIMMWQLEIMYGEQAVEMEIERKIKRLQERIEQ
jgi:NTP pyrophosphatase (non-canonical NTP hydrolase)